MRLLDYARDLGDASWELPRPPGGGRELICRDAALAVADEMRRLGVLVRCPRVEAAHPTGPETRHVMVEVALSKDGVRPAGATGSVYTVDWIRVPDTEDDWTPIRAVRPFERGPDHDPWLLAPFASVDFYNRMEAGRRRFKGAVLGDYLDVIEGRIGHFPGDPAFGIAEKLRRERDAAGWPAALARVQRRHGVAPDTAGPA